VGGFFHILPQYSRRPWRYSARGEPSARLAGVIKTPGQVALRWLIENPNVLPIPGAKNGKQALDNAGALTFFLTAGEIESLNRSTLAWRI
jgi:aryl-alcohol dehydrogenase-like predicted oxidoreductase